jgi:hypothetical protein
MSALGHKQTFALQNVMSALPPKATAKADFRSQPLQKLDTVLAKPCQRRAIARRSRHSAAARIVSGWP